jgi:type I restriction enzyme S subunit
VCIWCDGKGALNQHLFKVTSANYPKWFYYRWIKFYLPEFQQIAQGKATTMGHIQRHHLSASLVIVPSGKVLDKMNSVMVPLLDQVIVSGMEIRKLSEIRDSLLPRLMSGRIRVNAVI